MRTAICDDESFFLEKLFPLINEQNNNKEVTSYSSPQKLMTDIRSGYNPELVFMDIYFENNIKNGIDYAEEICRILPNVQIIFVTGNNRYSQDIFQKDVNICGFLLKDIDPDKLKYLFDKAKTKLLELENNNLVIVNKDATYVVQIEKLLYIESRGHLLVFKTEEEEFLTYGKVEEYRSRLSVNFFQCHKSYLVNMDKISRIEGNLIFMGKDIRVPIARSKYKETYHTFFSHIKSSLS